ncbi:MAG: DUF3306 domain-containing protein [Alphaproteobacteria bacterium]|nr:DUF3306 domain-containing protein [Alphaproteobacteria bacterium]
MSGDETFLRRWSRRKSEQRQAIVPVVSTEPEESRATGESASPASAVAPKPESELELPPIDSLGKDSDFTVFMREGVPEALKQQALRKLWASDPAFGAPDLLDIHAQDYSHLGRTKEVVRTAYQIGKGFVDEVQDAAEKIENKPEPTELRSVATDGDPVAPLPAAGGADKPKA